MFCLETVIAGMLHQELFGSQTALVSPLRKKRNAGANKSSPQMKLKQHGLSPTFALPLCCLPSPSRYLAATVWPLFYGEHNETNSSVYKHLGYLLQSKPRIAVARPLQILQIQRCAAGKVPPGPPRYPRPIGVSVFLLGGRISSRGHVAGTARWSPFPTL